jgi:hypothetical protein
LGKRSARDFTISPQDGITGPSMEYRDYRWDGSEYKQLDGYQIKYPSTR